MISRKIKSFLLKRRLRTLSGRVAYRDDFGNDLDLDLNQYIDGRLYLEGSYEKDIIQAVAEIMLDKRIQTFVDIGANAGFFSLGVARLVPDLNLLLFEPDPKTFLRLEKNLTQNQQTFRARKSFQKAITEISQEKVEFYRSDHAREFDAKKQNSGTNSLEYNPLRHDSKIEVETDRLDAIEMPPPKFIKIDVEGHELSVLKSYGSMYSRKDAYFLVEALGKKAMELRGFMEEKGYQLYRELPGDNFIYLPMS